MRVATIEIEGLTPYSQSKPLQTEKRKEESFLDFERRIWKEKMHVDDEGFVFIPPVSILNGMASAAAYLSKGGELKKKGQATWSQNFLCGLAIAEGPRINVKADAARSEEVYSNADGKRGSGTRVWRVFPMFDKWRATLVIHILDDSIPEEVFRRVVEAFGLFNGIGRYRPQNGGYLGRFRVTKLDIKAA